MRDQEKFLAKSTYQNAVDIMEKDISSKLIELNNILMEENLEFVESLIESGTPIIALSTMNEDIYKAERDSLKKETYKFPSFLNVGTLNSWHTTPSRILHGKMFPTEVPLFIPFESAPIAFIQNQKYKDSITNIMELITIKSISSLPNGLSRTIIIDKTGSGQNFPNLIKLHSKFNNDKIISEDNEIENELEAIKHSMSSVTSSITANGFTSIEDYNNNTDEIPQPYKFLLISNFPIGFSKKASESLLSILESGPRSGIYTIMSMSVDLKHGTSQSVSGISLEEFFKNTLLFDYSDRPHEYLRKGLIKENVNLYSAPFPNEDSLKELYNNTFKIVFETATKDKFDTYIKDLNERISAINIKPLIDIRKTFPAEFWTHEAGAGMCAQFAKNGIEDIFISLGINQWGEEEGTHHGLIGGSTGSGKTVLLHDIILHAAMRHSPRFLRFWLLDYKEGTEFATYENFPYIEILSMESEVEFGQEVLANALEILKKRSILFKKKGVSNLKNYNAACDNDNDKLHRIVIIIDEFQALFPKQPKVTAKTNMLIDQILRLGRSFGINLLLATQTLKGIDMEPQLMSNMPLRIGLKMDKKDVSKLFDENNHAPKSLSNPGEGIYNKQFGLSTANVNFQAYLALNDAVDEIKDMLTEKIKKEFSEEEYEELMESRFVYTGDKPGDISLNEDYIDKINNNKKFKDMSFYIGEYAGLSKDHSSFSLTRDFSENFIIVGMDIERAASIFYFALSQLAFNEVDTIIEFSNFNKKMGDFFEDQLSKFNNIKFSNNKTQRERLDETWIEFERRKTLTELELSKLPRLIQAYFFIEGSLLFSNPGHGSDSPMKKIEALISEGPELGIHTMLYATSMQTINAVGLSRELDKFKKKIGIPGGGNFLKLFGEEGTEVELSSSKNILLAHTGETGSSIYKFKSYKHEYFEIEEED